MMEAIVSLVVGGQIATDGGGLMVGPEQHTVGKESEKCEIVFLFLIGEQSDFD